MKANQTIRQDEEAVSPVIGVILMVAITVVLAAVVFVLVTKLSGSGNQTTPAIGFAFDDSSAKTATVTSAPTSIKWSDFTISGCTVSTGDVVQTSGGATISADGNMTAATQDVTAGDVITCTSGETLTISYRPTNGLVAQHKFP